MEWRCAECGEPESGKNTVLTVCHHCGKLLCKDDRTPLHGDVFDWDDDRTQTLAYHCADCYDTHHREPEFETGQPA
jgi:DNA-directed RNA polymerase subunit RPC12/RpoP